MYLEKGMLDLLLVSHKHALKSPIGIEKLKDIKLSANFKIF